MKNFAKLAMLSAVSAVMVVAPFAGASAHDHYWGGPGYWGGPRYWDHHHHHHHDHGDAVAAGVVGLAAGALIGSALSQPSQPQVIYQAPPPPPAYYPAAPRYYAPARPYYPPAPAAYKPIYQPWTPGWRAYCSHKYRSFNPRTGTYRGVDGLNHFCNAN